MREVPAGETQTRLDAAVAYTDGPLTLDTLQVLREVRQKAPNAKIVLMGYPLVMEQAHPSDFCNQDPSPNCEDPSPDCVLDTSPEELGDLRTVSGNLTSKQRLIAQSARSEGIDVIFADPTGAFAGKSACESESTRAINGISLALTPGESPLMSLLGYHFGTSSQSFHPNGRGTGLYAGVLTEALK